MANRNTNPGIGERKAAKSMSTRLFSRKSAAYPTRI